MTLDQIGNVDLEQVRYQHAVDHYGQALALYSAADDRAGKARALGNMGIAEVELGRHEQAAGNFEQALAMSREIGHRVVDAEALSDLRDAFLRTGEAGKATSPGSPLPAWLAYSSMAPPVWRRCRRKV